MIDDDAPPSRRRAWIGWTVFAVLAVLLVGGAWVGLRLLGAGIALGSAAQGAQKLHGMVVSGSIDDIGIVAKRIEADASNARTLASDPVWRVAESTPWVGDDLRAVREVSEVVDVVARRGLEPLVDAARGLDLGTLGLSGGHLDLGALADVAPSLDEAAAVFAGVQPQVREIAPSGLLPPVRDTVDHLVAELGVATRVTGALAGAADLLPGLIGGDAPHTYLLVVQSNAQLRSSGGAPVVLALLSGKDGSLRLAKPIDATGFAAFDTPVAQLPETVTALFGQDPALRMQNALSAPDFATGAQLAATMWTTARSGRIDGVIAVDAVALASLLEATGPLDVEGVTLDAENGVDYLLGDLYRERPAPQRSGAFLRALVSQLFGALAGGKADARATLAALGAAGDDGRLRVWSADPELQERLARTSLAGGIADDSAAVVRTAVLLNDTTGGAMDTFADAAVDARIGACGPDGRAVLRVTVDWSSSAPADAAASLPASITADGRWGVPAGTIGTRVAVFGPQGWRVSSADADGEVAAQVTTAAGERQVVQYELRTPPGGTQRIVVEFTAPRASAGERAGVEVLSTPMAHDTPVRTGELACG